MNTHIEGKQYKTYPFRQCLKTEDIHSDIIVNVLKDKRQEFHFFFS